MNDAVLALRAPVGTATVVLVCLLSAPGSPLWAQDPKNQDVQDRLKKLEEQNRELQKQVDALQKQPPPAPRPEAPGEAPKFKVSGYVDLGFFAPSGSGVGFVPDTNGTQRANYPTIPWILLGDPWTTAVNSRGEPASTKGSFALPFDAINSNGRSSFLVNEVNVDLWAGLTPNTSLVVSMDFLPRTGTGGTLGDSFEVDFAYFQWEPFDAVDMEVQVGKFASAFGYEYRLEESPARIGITPSLIGRYVSGHPIGIKVRNQWLDKHLTTNVALINGSSNIETFPFGSEIDANDAKTASGRVSYDFSYLVPGVTALSLGLSGEIGAQVRQPDNGVYQKQYGMDFQFEIADFEFILEMIRGRAPGGGQTEAPSLDFRGGYVQAAYHVFEWMTPYVRGEYRKAVHLGTDFVYVMDEGRVTGGVRFDIARNIILKLEYVHNFERGPLPTIDNDVFAASLVLKF